MAIYYGMFSFTLDTAKQTTQNNPKNILFLNLNCNKQVKIKDKATGTKTTRATFKGIIIYVNLEI